MMSILCGGDVQLIDCGICPVLDDGCQQIRKDPRDLDPFYEGLRKLRRLFSPFEVFMIEDSRSSLRAILVKTFLTHWYHASSRSADEAAWLVFKIPIMAYSVT